MSSAKFKQPAISSNELATELAANAAKTPASSSPAATSTETGQPSTLLISVNKLQLGARVRSLTGEYCLERELSLCLEREKHSFQRLS